MIAAMFRAIPLFAAASLGLASMPAGAESPRPVDVRAKNDMDCSLRLTNDSVEDTMMMQDTTGSVEACRAACAAYEEQWLAPMREASTVLRYACLYRNDVIAEVDLIQADLGQQGEAESE